MPRLHEALGTGENSSSFTVVADGDVMIRLLGDYDGETFTLQIEHDGAFEDLTFDLTAGVCAFDGSTTGKQRNLSLAGGDVFRLAGDGNGTATDVDVFVNGNVRF